MGSGVTGENYVQAFKDVAAADPDIKLYGPDGVAEEAFTEHEEGHSRPSVAARTKITVATLGSEGVQAAGQREGGEVLRRLRQRRTARPTPIPTRSTATRR
ncbi:MAG: hypothetical protein WKF40_09280 [Thermoleophilaceae bacterium]